MAIATLRGFLIGLIGGKIATEWINIMVAFPQGDSCRHGTILFAINK